MSRAIWPPLSSMSLSSLSSLLLAFWLTAVAGCHPPKDAEIVSSLDTRATIGFAFTADTTRLQPAEQPSGEAGVRALAAVLSSHLASVGILRDDKADGVHLDIVADLPAAGFALRARLTPKLDLLCQVTIEPIATGADEHPVSAAPWSVHNAFEDVHRRVATLQPSKQAPMAQAQFARLRAEAALAAGANKDPWLTPAEYVRVPRPISDEGPDRGYWVPPSEPSGLLGP
ncbi:MAG: hypothetical protein JWN44_1357 [Myxococcales bacterium]|nr:hypothetical protein [Myxococcales bacterium]